MHFRQSLLSILAVCLLIISCEQKQPLNKNLLYSGPFLGYTEHFEQLLFMELSQNVKTVNVKYWPSDNPADIQTINQECNYKDKYNAFKLVIPYLNEGTKYGYSVLLNGVEQNIKSSTFKTKELWEWRKDAPDFSFLFGSCTFINDSLYDRPGKGYGQDYSIFDTMLKHKSDFTLWGGDNVYLREVDWSSNSGIQYRYHHTRAAPEVQRIMSSRPNYAIWDDHDFGPNNSHRAYPLKKEALKAFKEWWGNKTYGEPDNEGTYSYFQWSDADFFLLDNRYHRSPNKMLNNSGSDYLGKKQLSWLKESLIESRASFKFIVNGNQFFNTYAYNECFLLYREEFNELIDFIKENKIRGVVFLSGDRHLTEVYKINNPDFYPFYEITCSPFTPKPYDISKKEEFNNPARLEGSLVMEQNFMNIKIQGDRKNRELVIETYNIDNELKFKYSINKSDLSTSKNNY